MNRSLKSLMFVISYWHPLRPVVTIEEKDRSEVYYSFEIDAETATEGLKAIKHLLNMVDPSQTMPVLFGSTQGLFKFISNL